MRALRVALSLLAAAAVAVSWSPGTMAAAPPVMVKDINDTTASDPRDFVVAGGRAFFFTETPAGCQLWVSDGTSVGTTKLADLSSDWDTCALEVALARFGHGVIFNVNTHLWRSDGTVDGTTLIRSGTPNQIAPMTQMRGRLYFTDIWGALWRTDGTGPGTRRVWQGGEFPGLEELTPIGKTLYFVSPATACAPGPCGAPASLWRSDGTATGTKLIKWVAGSDLVALGGKLYFVRGFSGGTELWTSDGTRKGTQRVLDIDPNGDDRVSGLTVVGDALAFAATDGSHGIELWASDGTAAGTKMVRDIDPRRGSQPKDLIAAGSRLYFTAFDAAHGRRLWMSDGSQPGTRPVSSLHGTPEAAIGTTLYFAANDGTGKELWKTDGTPGGTVRVKDIAPTGGSDPAYLTPMGGSLLFAADDGLHGAELWRSDGSEPGTSMVKDMEPAQGSDIAEITAVNGRAYFAATEPDCCGLVRTLFVSDGTRHGTHSVSMFAEDPTRLVKSGDKLFFTAVSWSDEQDPPVLWTSDGTQSGTVMLTDPDPDWWATRPTAVGDRVFFGWVGGEPSQLWVSDGTKAGTHLVKETDTSNRTAVGDTLFFTNDHQLWKSDGTDAGTVMVAEVDPGGPVLFPFDNLAAVGGRLFFTVTDADYQTHLWTSDGTEAGTVPIDGAGVYPANLNGMGGILYFSAANPAGDTLELWRSDGTDAGTWQITADGCGPGDVTSPGESAVSSGRLYFVAWDCDLGSSELWTTDGTLAGTTRVADINPGGNADPAHLTNVGGTLFFTADDGTHGRELWRTDGTSAGTTMVGDVNPSGGSDPDELTNVAGTLYFTADDGLHGRELWAFAP